MAYKGFPSNDCWFPTICKVLYDNFPNCSNSFEARKTSSAHIQYGRRVLKQSKTYDGLHRFRLSTGVRNKQIKNGKKLTLESETYAQLLPSTRCQPSSIRKNNVGRVQVNEYFSHLWTFIHFNQRARAGLTHADNILGILLVINDIPFHNLIYGES